MANSLVLLVVSLVFLAGCGVPPAQPPDAAPVEAGAGGSLSSQSSIAAADTSDVRLIAVGDIADCNVRTDEKVAAVVAGLRGKIATLGDNAYPAGSLQNFTDCFDPKWGALTSRMFPAPGNHEYQTAGAAGYFGYFAGKGRHDIGDPGQGWYAYDLGTSWRAISLNSNCDRVGGCTKDSPQGQWLAAELERAGDRHVLAYWHAPRYSGGDHGSILEMRPFFRMLYRARADIVLGGHDHSYERFAPQNASGDYRRRGVQQFVVGTGGGKRLYPFEAGSRLPNTRARSDDTFGVLQLRLRADGYSWRFVRAAGGDFTDSGSRTLE